MDAESFKVIDRAGEADNFDFATIAGACVDFADVQGAAEEGSEPEAEAETGESGEPGTVEG